MLREQVYARRVEAVPLRDFHPFPRYEDRAVWEGADARIRALALDSAREKAGYGYPMILATDYMECRRTGDRTRQETPYFQRREALSQFVLAECFEGQGRYLDDIINGVWCICEEASWVVGAHNFIYEEDPANLCRTLPDPDMQTLDIFAGETAMLLSMTAYLLGRQLDAVEPLVTRRIRRVLGERILDPFLSRYDYWWMGYSERRDINNWGPWCVVNCLTCLLLTEPEDDRRARGVVRAMDMLDRYLDGVGEDGGCDEGATYWGRACGMLLEGLLLTGEATGGAVDVFNEPKLQSFADYIRRMYIARDRVVNFADGAARCNPPAELLYSAGLRMRSDTLCDFGAYLFRWQLARGIFPLTSLSRAVRTVAASAAMLHVSAAPRFEGQLYIDSLQILAARETPDPERGFFLCAKGGHNADSHNHNDVGHFVLSLDGWPVLIDPGVEVYTMRFFSEQRYAIWTMQSKYHNLPTIGGTMQKDGRAFAARGVRATLGEAVCALEMDIAGAYPASAGVERYTRALTLDRAAGCVLLEDHWALARPEPVALHFMTVCSPSLCDSGVLFTGEHTRARMLLPLDGLDTSIERIELNDPKLCASWGACIWRITLTTREPAARGAFSARFVRAKEPDALTNRKDD